MSFPHPIFKAYDIRGVVDSADASSNLSEHLAQRIGQALGSAALAHGCGEFVIGRDGRVSGPRMAAAVADGVRASGCDVIDIGMAPTPTLYFAAAQHGGSGAQITASHNPPQYNGLKMMLAGTPIFGAGIQALKARVIDGDVVHGAGALRSEDALAAYGAALLADINLAKTPDIRALKVVIDCGNGVAGVAAPSLLRAIGCQVIELFCEVDGTFPNHHPDPSQPQNLQDLIAAVRHHGADFGMAFDGDGDRLGVVSGDGSIVWPDRQMHLFVRDILAQRPGAEIIFDVKCSQTLRRAIESQGGVATMCKTGHSFIKHKLRQTGAAFAGEMSGHLYFNDRWGGFDDGIYAAARLCELLAGERRTPTEVFAALPNTVNTPELLAETAEGEQHVVLDELRAQLAATDLFADAEISRLDGIRADFADGFGLVRASNTTPAVSFRFEAGSDEQLAMIQARFRDLLRATRPNLRLPF